MSFGDIVIIETKGDDRDNSDSEGKLKLGKAWESQANQLTHNTGYKYHCSMVFETKPIDGALTPSEALSFLSIKFKSKTFRECTNA